MRKITAVCMMVFATLVLAQHVEAQQGYARYINMWNSISHELRTAAANFAHDRRTGRDTEPSRSGETPRSRVRYHIFPIYEANFFIVRTNNLGFHRTMMQHSVNIFFSLYGQHSIYIAHNSLVNISRNTDGSMRREYHDRLHYTWYASSWYRKVDVTSSYFGIGSIALIFCLEDL